MQTPIFFEEVGPNSQRPDYWGNIRTSKGSVRFLRNEGETSELIGTDARFYWDEEEILKVHVTGYPFKNLEEVLGAVAQEINKKQQDKNTAGVEDTLKSKTKKINSNYLMGILQELYLSRTNITELNDDGIPNLKFLNLSDNDQLQSIQLSEAKELEEFNAFGCKNLASVSLKGTFRRLRKMDLSYSAVNELEFNQIHALEYLNITKNNLAKLNIASLSNLKYLFAEENENLELVWGKKWNLKKLSILSVSNSNKKLPKDIIVAGKKSDDDLREAIISFLNLKSKLGEEEVEYINRVQLILLGNTTAGKTEMKYKLLDAPRESFKSTHGVDFFQKKFGTEYDDLEIVGFDFGGQDYYHALHLPFFDDESYFLLIWGNYDESKRTWGTYGPDNFAGKKKEKLVNSVDAKKEISEGDNLRESLIEEDERLYPMNYWLKSISSIDDDSEKNEGTDFGPNQKVIGDRPKVSLIQNLRTDTKEYYLNIKDLRNRTDVQILNMNNFNLKEEKLQSFLLKQIGASFATQKHFILKAVKEIGEELNVGEEVVMEEKALLSFIEGKKGNLEGDIETFINSLYNYRYLLKPGLKNKELKGYYVVRPKEFIESIYAILREELLTSDKNRGYFTYVDADKRIHEFEKEKQVKVSTDFLIKFLIQNDIVFEVSKELFKEKKAENDSKEKGIKRENIWYVAPTYLSQPLNKIESLFIDSFEEADCIFKFHDFFHPNLILKVVKQFRERLVIDIVNSKYLMWKNCVIIYNDDNKGEGNEKDSNQVVENKGDITKNYLKLQLLLPDKDNPDIIPQFTIARSKSGFVPNDQFSKVFNETKNLLSRYNPEIWIKVPYKKKKYIPYDVVKKTVHQSSPTNSLNKDTGMVYYDGILYPIYAFRYFLGNDFQAPLKIFIAYSKFDDVYREELRDHLRPMVRSGQFEVFDDREMDLGEDWDARLKNELEQCDVFIVLLSSKTLGTPYVVDKEIPLALERKANGLMIVPIVVQPCNWEITGLGSTNIYDKAQSIGLNRDDLNMSRELSVEERALKWKDIAERLSQYQPLNDRLSEKMENSKISKSLKPLSTNLKLDFLKVYVAYDERDGEYQKELGEYLRPGVNGKRFKVFDKRENYIENEWEESESKEEIQNSHIFIILISIKSLANSSLMNKELPMAMERARAAAMIIIPVVVGPCNWKKYTELEELNGKEDALTFEDIGLKIGDLQLDKEITLNGRGNKWLKIVEQLEKFADDRRKQATSPSTPDEPAAGEGV